MQGPPVAVCLLLLATLAAPCACGFSHSFKETEFPCHRLPLNVRPTKYDLELTFPSFDSDTYEGQVDIAVEFSTGKRSRACRMGLKDCDEVFDEQAKALEGVTCDVQGDPSQILLHADESLDIQSVKVSSEPHLKFLYGEPMKERQVTGLTRDKSKQMIGIQLKQAIRAKSAGVISFTFKGKMRQDKRGVYVSTYDDGKTVYKHIVSQFQPTDARTVFPSFDEPRFKVPFTIKLTHSNKLTAHSNTEVAHFNLNIDRHYTSTVFKTTPPMPIHMVAFVVGEFDKPLEMELPAGSGQRSKRSQLKKVRVFTAPGKRESGRFALQVASDSLQWFESYIDYEFPLEKLDVIAIADHDKDNTESWGLVFVRDTLLWIDDETKPDTKITTAVNVAHVVVHQWFANLVSAAWWSELWITEGVAAQFAFNIVADLYDFQSEYFVRIATLSGVMQTDQPGGLHSLSPKEANLQTSEQIYGIFDNLEFMKSASLAQMLEDSLVNDDWYQESLRRLVMAHAYKTITLNDYMNALAGKGKVENFDQHFGMLKSFSKFHGVPLINVDLDSSKRPKVDVEAFAHARYSADAVPKKQEQDLSIYSNVIFAQGATTSRQTSGAYSEIYLESHAGKDKSYCLKPPAWFEEPKFGSGFFIKMSPNPSIATFYRTRYSDELLIPLKAAIKNKWIGAMDRLQILDDSTQLVQVQLMMPDTFKSLLEAYADEDDNAVLIAMLVASKTLATLRTRDDYPSTFAQAFLRLFDRYGFTVRNDETFIEQRARQVVLKALITQGNQQVIDAALQAFESTANSAGGVALFLREPVYTAVVLSNDSVGVERLLIKLEKTNSYEEKIRLVTVLSLSKDKGVLARLQTWLASSGLKKETVQPFETAIAQALEQ